jgi:hypothetical protein
MDKIHISIGSLHHLGNGSVRPISFNSIVCSLESSVADHQASFEVFSLVWSTDCEVSYIFAHTCRYLSIFMRTLLDSSRNTDLQNCFFQSWSRSGNQRWNQSDRSIGNDQSKGNRAVWKLFQSCFYVCLDTNNWCREIQPRAAYVFVYFYLKKYNYNKSTGRSYRFHLCLRLFRSLLGRNLSNDD